MSTLCHQQVSRTRSTTAQADRQLLLQQTTPKSTAVQFRRAFTRKHVFLQSTNIGKQKLKGHERAAAGIENRPWELKRELPYTDSGRKAAPTKVRQLTNTPDHLFVRRLKLGSDPGSICGSRVST